MDRRANPLKMETGKKPISKKTTFLMVMNGVVAFLALCIFVQAFNARSFPDNWAALGYFYIGLPLGSLAAISSLGIGLAYLLEEDRELKRLVLIIDSLILAFSLMPIAIFFVFVV